MAYTLFRMSVWWCGVLALSLGVFNSAYATSMKVAPVRLALTSLRPIAAMTIGNGEESEMAVQAEVLEWSQEHGTDVYRPTQDVLVNPTIFRLGGSSQQIVRVGLRVPAGARERSYRIFLQQLPRDQALPSDDAGGARLQTLLRIGVPIFVAPLVVTHDVRWRLTVVKATPDGSDGIRYALVVDNQGTEHVQLTRVVIRTEKGVELAQTSLSMYVLAGQSSTLPFDLPPLEPDAQVQVQTQSDAAVALPAALVRVPRREATLR